MQIRRPIFLLALGAWLLCLLPTAKAGVLILPLFCILLLLFPMKLWLVLLCFLPLLLPPAPAQPYHEGHFHIAEEGVLRPRRTIRCGGGVWQYVGTLTPGEYEGSLRLIPFPEKNARWYQNNALRASGVRGEAQVLRSVLCASAEQPLRSRILHMCYERMEGFGAHRGIAYSLLFGLREGLEPEVEEGLRALGVLHLFVLSGLHLGIYSRGVLSACRLLGIPRCAAEGLAFAFVLFFCFLSGWHVSALRTLLLGTLRTASFFLKRRADPLESLSAVCLLLLWMNPGWAGSLSFLLGTAAVAALRLARKGKLLWMHLALLPLQLLLLERLSLPYLLANVLLGFLSAPVLGVLMLSFLFPPLQPLAGILLGGIVRALYHVRSVEALSALMPVPLPLSCAFVYLSFFAWLLLPEKEILWNRWKKRALLLTALVLILTGMLPRLHRRWQTGVTFFDVGQGDAALILSASGETILIDTGRDEALLRTLRSLGIGRIDHLILTHLDEDHSGLADAIAHEYLYVPFTEEGGIPLRRGDRLEIAEVHIEVLHPEVKTGISNEDSLVLLVEAFGKRILFAGDVSGAVLERVGSTPVDVLKFPHHGAQSSLSAASLDALRPALTILSVGRNRYGHPSPSVIEALELRGLRYHSTFESGHLFLREAGFRSY